MVERQRRPFGKDHNVLALQKTLVRLPHQFPKNAFPSVPHNRFAQPTPHHNSDPGIPETRPAGGTTLKNCVVMRWPSRFTRSKSSFFFKNNGGHREGTSLIGYGQALAAFSATAGKHSSPVLGAHSLSKPMVTFSFKIRRLSICHGHGK